MAFQADAFQNNAFQVAGAITPPARSPGSAKGGGALAGTRANENTEEQRQRIRDLEAAVEAAYREVMGLDQAEPVPDEIIAALTPEALDAAGMPVASNVNADLINAMIMRAYRDQQDEQDIADLLNWI